MSTQDMAAEGTTAASSHLQSEATLGATGSQRQRCSMPLWQAPEAWLQLLVNREHFRDGWYMVRGVTNLMSANRAMCEAVLRCMDRWRLAIQVGRGPTTTGSKIASLSSAADPAARKSQNLKQTLVLQHVRVRCLKSTMGLA
jgi:hypothetical protein